VSGALAVKCDQAVSQRLDQVDITGGSVGVSPITINSDAQEVTVAVMVPIKSSSSVVTPQLFFGKSIISSVKLLGETTSSAECPT